MTRSKALSYFDSFEDVKIIDKIYDDIESQTCENCKYGFILDFEDDFECSSEYMIEQFNTYPQYPLTVDKTFGCNQFIQSEPDTNKDQ